MKTPHPHAEQQAAPNVAPGNGWLQSGALLYRLTDDRKPCNRDEIRVTMADGSHTPEACARRAGELLDRIRAAPQQEAQEPVATQWLAEMIMSDCGCSTQNQRLLDRIVERITRYDAANTAPQPAPAPLSDDDVKDAARYRWLIDQHWIQTEVDWRLISTDQDSTIKQLDAAIDAAIAAQGGK